MLGSTGATLVAPYLTMPLMDKVLIPFQNSQAIDPSLVAWLLSGLFGAALVSWALGWGKTYLLALVSGASRPTCAPPPSSICWAYRSNASAPSARAT